MPTPVIIGVGDIVNRSTSLEDALEPADLMINAIQEALQDTHSQNAAELRGQIDSVDVVACWTWPYDDLPGVISAKLDIQPARRHVPDYHGGNQPARLLDDAARRIAAGTSHVAVVCGGEALASLASFAKAQKLPPLGWTPISTDISEVFSPTAARARDQRDTPGTRHSVGAPIHVYPMYENALRAHLGQSLAHNNSESAELYAEFANVAANQKFAWNYGKPAETAATIGTLSKKNRMICFPYPLLMNAFNTVNLAAACILTSTVVAQKLGVPEDRWIFPLGGAGTRDSYEFWLRPTYHQSPCISQSLDAALKVSGLHAGQVDLFDFYSCFPIVPKLACRHLGLPTTKSSKPITVLGGLTSFGGAGNNYSMHAITEMVRQMRLGKGHTALVLANGGMVTYQHVVCLSKQPRQDGKQYPQGETLPAVITDVPAPLFEESPKGDCIIETYTVEFDRSGRPQRGHVVGLLRSNGHRFLANHGNESTLQQLASSTKEPIGREGTVRQDPGKKGRNVFFFGTGANL